MAHAHIIYSGHLRTFAKTWRNHAYFIWRHFEDATIYFSLEDEGDTQEKLSIILAKARVENQHFNFRMNFVKQPQEELDKWNNHPSQHHAPYALSVPPAAVVGQLWHLQKAYEFATNQFNLVEAESNGDYFIRIRTDLWFHDTSCLANAGSFFDENKGDNGSAFWQFMITPYWGRFGGLNDRFAVMGSLVASNVFKAYRKLGLTLKTDCPLHPESIFLHNAESVATRIKFMPIMFSTLRENGEMRWPEILAYEQPNN